MKKTIFIVPLLFLFSCSQHAIHYEYNNVCITRIDGDAESYFYYGNYNINDKLPSTYLKATYHGFDGGMAAYIIFEKDKKIALVGLMGWFEKTGNDSLIYIRKFNDVAEAHKWNDSIKHNLQNVVSVSDLIKFEKQDNNSNNSKVKSSY